MVSIRKHRRKLNKQLKYFLKCERVAGAEANKITNCVYRQYERFARAQEALWNRGIPEWERRSVSPTT